MTAEAAPIELDGVVRFDARQLDRVFPFHLAFDRSLTIVRAGPSVARVWPDLTIGSRLDEHTGLLSPKVSFTYDSLERQQHALILLRTRNNVTLRGQVVATEADVLVFVGSPWIADPALLEETGVTLSDFALHDSVADYMFLLQAQTTALQDARRLAARLRQIDEEKARLAEAEQALAHELNALPDLVLRMDAEGTLLDVRPAKERALPVPASELVGTPAFTAFPEMADQLGEGLARAFVGGRTQSFEYSALHAGIECFYEARVVRCSEQEAIALVRDVSERHQLQRQLMYQAFHDSLTGLANRALFEDRVGHALMRSGGRPEHIAVLFIDLDDFKLVNDTLGHRVGDRLLVAVANRLKHATRPVDTIARLGGDEFAVLLEDGENDMGFALASRLIKAFEEPFETGEVPVTVGASIGVAYGSRESIAEDLLRNADLAMYAAKGAGKGRPAVFESEMQDRLLAQLMLEGELRDAIAQRQFRVLYQPVIDVASGRLVGTEALVRWQHPTRGLLPPSEFIPLAEQTGMIVPIGALVLEEAATQAAAWATDRPISVSVNVSTRQLVEPGLVEKVSETLATTGLPPALLVLEVTETALISDAERAAGVLGELKALGVRIALDDFGTGYSSLAHLLRFPIDTLKVDKSFIDQIPQQSSASALAKAILGIGRILSVDVVAEGVETEHQLQMLKAWECQHYQGYLFAPPIEPANISELIRDPGGPGGTEPAGTATPDPHLARWTS